MKASERGVAFIAAHEGVVLRAYPDPGSGGEPWTIGVGHTSRAGPPEVFKGMTITRAKAFDILAYDVRTFEEAVEEAVTVSLAQREFDALVSFTMNVGPANLERSTLLRKLNAGDFEGAAEEFPKWKRAAGRVLPGLVRRRAEEAELFLHGDYGSAGLAETDSPNVPSLLVRGATGDAVTAVQEQLFLAGYEIEIDGIFGRDTEAAVSKFQRADDDLTVDGKVGRATRAALKRAANSPDEPEVPDAPEVEAIEAAVTHMHKALDALNAA